MFYDYLSGKIILANSLSLCIIYIKIMVYPSPVTYYIDYKGQVKTTTRRGTQAIQTGGYAEDFLQRLCKRKIHSILQQQGICMEIDLWCGFLNTKMICGKVKIYNKFVAYFADKKLQFHSKTFIFLNLHISHNYGCRFATEYFPLQKIHSISVLCESTL